jgi:5-methylcytosine-specific restriction endonuclease McrA
MPVRHNLRELQQKILSVLEKYPEGVDITAIREELGIQGHQHFDRRVRELYPYYDIVTKRSGRKTLYILKGQRPEGEWKFARISKKLRAKILARDGQRCQLCGKTVKDDLVHLHIDHKIPESWGGESNEDNLWALCSTCNEGKKNYFKTFDSKLMIKIMNRKSVHERIAYLLKANINEWVDSDLIEFVANFLDYQTDWRKRLREIRYFGLKIESKRKKIGRRTKSYYRLLNWEILPKDLSKAAREYEKERASMNRSKM